ncbi:hypothetical protein [Litorilituus lipolyticus]|uniref:Uncharacterized protein n=1 Tax=Litorilituus lipolyticus TaxID=2491017 RepID=A0A502LC36_9GAMM|nr:hypothetical protein [Litorilituus lipolyticus]TPH17697.1 hypothetical protein EPA86_03865 [Litorilituus lipolyticus]
MEMNKELDIVTYEDFHILKAMWQKEDLTNADIRNTGTILRSFLIYNTLQQVANPRKYKLEIEGPNNKPIEKANKKGRIEFFQSGGTTVLGIYLSAFIVNKGANAVCLDNYHPDQRETLRLSAFLKQPVFFINKETVTRQQVIAYVANKSGNAHFDKKRKGVDKTIDLIRSAVSMSIKEGVPTFGFDLKFLKEPNCEFIINPNELDPIFVETAATARFITESPVILGLMDNIKKEHNL